MSRAGIAIALVAAALVGHRCCDGPAPPARWRCATFNIENFPKHDRQVSAAFDEIARLDAAVVAVQEILEPQLFAATARDRLGPDWDFVALDTSPRDPPQIVQHLGVLFDRRVFELVATRGHDGTRLDGRYKPTFDVELRATAGGEHVRVLVVHLKAGGDNQPIRARQYAALRAIVAEATRPGARVILLGDFNATGDADRRELARLAAATHLRWVSEPLACSSFWALDDSCPRARLDHVLTTPAATDVRAAGGCAVDGCAAQDRCPVYAEQVSDHCPVVVTLER
jgi:endonuclease/exonuclease/phosphatase family metal-dependent hydrolase